MADTGSIIDAGLTAGGDLISGIGTLIGGQISSQGYRQEANLYSQAATLEIANEQYQRASTNISQILQQRRAAQTIGAQEAAVGAAGFAEGGSALALLRESKINAGIGQGMIGLQGAINEATYQEQAFGYQAQSQGALGAASAASTGGILGFLGGIAKAGSAIVPFL